MNRHELQKHLRIIGILLVGLIPTLLTVVGFCYSPTLAYSAFAPFLIIFDGVLARLSYLYVERESIPQEPTAASYQSQDVESIDDAPPSYGEVVRKAPSYEMATRQEVSRSPESIPVPAPMCGETPPPQQCHNDRDENATNPISKRDLDLPTYEEAIAQSSNKN